VTDTVEGRLSLRFCTTDIERTVGAMLACDLSPGRRGDPAAEVVMRIDRSTWPEWERRFAEGDCDFRLDWDTAWISGFDERCATLARWPFHFSPRSVQDLLPQIPFDYVTAIVPDPEWWSDPRPPGRTGPGEGHGKHGWMIAFRGEAGHARMGSRRILDRGPWRVLRDEQHDITMLQLFDLQADEQTAWRQFMPGQHRIGMSLEGAFINLSMQIAELAPTHYLPEQRVSIVLVQEREVSPREMLEATAVKLLQPYPGQPVDQVRFVFLDEQTARRQLYDLWVRGLEVHAFVDGSQVRLDDGFEPPSYEPPDWVRAVEQREG
jgi:hypothetical protein